MPRKLSKKKTLKGGWPGTKPKPNQIKKINTLKGGWGNSENNLPLEKKKPKKQSTKKKSKKVIKGPMQGGSWRSKSVFF